MEDLIVLLIVAIIVVLAGLYVYKAKKNGKKCIGCPYAETCGKNNQSSCNGNSSCCSSCNR